MANTNTNKISFKRFIITMFLGGVFYVIMFALFMHYIAPKRVEDCPKCMEAIAQYKASLIAMKDPNNESFYYQGGGINPGFKTVVSKKTVAEQAPQTRAYEQQLAEYNKLVAEREKAIKEAQRLAAEEAARERALLEQAKAERLKMEQEMKKTQSGTGTSKTFTPRNVQQATPQRTQIGTLKTSKLGEGTFQQ